MKTALGLLLLATVGWARHVIPLPKHTYDGKPGEVNTKIINGINATPGQFPYQGGIQSPTGSHVCGGSLITSTWLVTAAHCIPSPPSSYRIVLGLHDLSNYNNGGQPEIYGVASTFLHPGYSTDPNIGFPNDVALMQLSLPANLNNPFIETILLAPDNGDTYVGAECYVSGWGYIDVSFTPAGILQYIRTNVITNDECASRTNPAWLNPNQICVFTGNSGVCYGDSGGPLMCRRNGISYLIGDSNWMVGDCDIRFPSVFIRLQNYRAWIGGIIGPIP